MNPAPIPLEVHGLTVAYRDRPALWAVDFSVQAGDICAIVGPNGAGKSTLLKAIMGLQPIAGGWVKIFGSDVKDRRVSIAYVPQRGEVDWDFPIQVYDVVLMGRYGRLPFYRRPRFSDHDAAGEALRRVGMEEFSNRQIRQLSGGQQQRVFIARALAQEATIYLLDEPFAGVDAATEQTLVEIFRDLSSQGKTIIAVHHDLHSVPEYFSSVVLLNMRVVAAGKIHSVFTSENLQATYGGRLGVLAEVSERLREVEAQRLHKV